MGEPMPGVRDCPCCGEPTHAEDIRLVVGLFFCAWCVEMGCPKAIESDDTNSAGVGRTREPGEPSDSDGATVVDPSRGPLDSDDTQAQEQEG
jgi:hypothetical protein